MPELAAVQHRALASRASLFRSFRATLRANHLSEPRGDAGRRPAFVKAFDPRAVAAMKDKLTHADRAVLFDALRLATPRDDGRQFADKRQHARLSVFGNVA